MSSSRIGRPLILAAAAGLLLSGCGSLSAGTAATVGDETISLAQVDRAAEAVCRSFEDQLVEAGQVVPLSEMRQYAVGLLAASSQARQIAEEFDVDPGTDHQRETARLAAEAEDAVPEELREEYVAIGSTESLVNSVILAAGRAALAEEGVTEVEDEQAMQRGSELMASWTEENGVEVDPRFGLELREGQLHRTDTGTSVAVSDTARAGIADQADPAYSSQLPSNQRCG